MSTNNLSAKHVAAIVTAALLAIAGIVTLGMFLREYGPGNMGNGFFAGAGIAIAALAIAWWRAVRHPGSATSLERAWTTTGDERDDAVLTRHLPSSGSARCRWSPRTIILSVGGPLEPVRDHQLCAHRAVRHRLRRDQSPQLTRRRLKASIRSNAPATASAPAANDSRTKFRCSPVEVRSGHERNTRLLEQRSGRAEESS